MDKVVEVKVRERSHGQCEYCGLLQSLSPLLFQLDHIIPKQHGGNDELINLAIACMFCNSHKEPNLTGIDPVTGVITPLFHPRRDHWHAHFKMRGAWIEGTSGVGRATIAVLAMNHPVQIALRDVMVSEVGPR